MNNNLENAGRPPQAGEPHPRPSAETTPSSEWTPVSSRYATLLRCHVSFYALLLAALPHLWVLHDPSARLGPVSIGVLLAALPLLFIWVPRRVRFTQYRRNPLDMHMRTGLWWRTQTAVAINRVQHLEITQGPLERILNLSRLVLYTAGGLRSDLRLPGLETATAEYLKRQLLQQIVDEVEEAE